MKLLSVPIFVLACVLLYLGSGMLFLVPGYPGEAYFARNRVIYGVLPALASAVLLAVVGWLWAQQGKAGSLSKSLKVTYALASAAVTLFWLGLMIIGGMRQG